MSATQSQPKPQHNSTKELPRAWAPPKGTAWRKGESGWKLHKVNLLRAEGILNLTKIAQALSESSKACLKTNRPRRMWDNTPLSRLPVSGLGERPGGGKGEKAHFQCPLGCGPWAQPATPLGFSTHTAAAPQREASPRDQATRRWTSASPNLVRPRSARDLRSYLLLPGPEDCRQTAAPAPAPAAAPRPRRFRRTGPLPSQARGTKADLRSTSRGDAAPDPVCPQLRRESTKSAAAADPGDAGCRSEPPSFS